MHRFTKSFAALCAVCALGACSKSLNIALEVIPSCETPEVLGGLSLLKVRTEGAGLDAPRDAIFDLVARKGTLSDVPPTDDARITVTAYQSDSGAAADVGGAIGGLNLSGQRSGATEVRVFIGPTDSFMRTSQGAAPSTCSDMAAGRQGHTITRFADGRVMIAGGEKLANNVSELVRQTEIFDPPTGQWSPGPDLPEGRAYHTATLLKNNKVLLCGGIGVVNGRTGTLQSCALLDVASKRFEEVAPTLVQGRMQHTATLLDDGRVIIAGGRAIPIEYLDTTEVYSDSGKFTAGTKLAEARAQHTAHVMSNGRVALIGGRVRETVVGSVEVWTAVSSTVVATLAQPRYAQASAAMPDGRIAIGGGFVGVGEGGNPAATALIEMFDPSVGTSGVLACQTSLNLSDQRGQLTAASVAATDRSLGGVVFLGGTRPDGQVVDLAELLVAGKGRGCSDLTVRNTTGRLRFARTRAEAVPLLGGDVLVTAGSSSVGATALPVAASEIYVIPR